jgi:CSLREA domain-containing protein
MRTRTFVATLLAVTVGVPWVVSTGGSPVVVAASFTVTSLLDGHDDDLTDGVCDTGTGACTLRAAIEQANHLGGGHQITLGPGVHRVGTNAGTVSPVRIDITADITLVGAGRADTTITLDSASGSDVFKLLTNASLSMSALTLTQEAGSGWADGIVVAGDGASLFVDDVLFLGLGDVPVAAWGTGSDPDPANFDIWIEDSTFDGAGEGYSLLAVSSGGAEIDIVRTEIHSTTYALLVDNDAATPAGDDVLRITDSVLDGSLYYPDDPENGVEAYGNFDVELSGTTIRNHATGIRADSSRMTVTGSEIVDNKYIGIWFSGWDDAATVSIDRTLIARNGQSALDVNGDMTLTNSTLSDNAAGGYTAFGLSDAALVENTTISGNHSSGIYLPTGSTLRNVTITDNGLVDDFDGVGLFVDGDVTMHNTVIAGNRFDCWTGPSQPVVTGDHNADGDGGCGLDGPNDLSGIDPLLGPLADNGGPTPTHAPLPGSPLLDAGNDAECPATDQRGAARPFDGDASGTAQCDIGAVEAGSEVLTSTGVTWSATIARRGMLAPDDPLVIEATSVPGGTATAQVSLSSWYPGGDTTAPIAGAPAPAEVAVALTEGPAGVYTGSLPLTGVTEITAVEAVVTESGQDRVGSTTTALPVQVAGAIELTTALGVPAWSLPTARAHIASGTTADGDSLIVAIDGVTQSRWLRPATDYELDLVDGEQRRIVPTTSAIEVRGGLVTPVTMDDVALPYVPFSLVVEDANGAPVSDVKVTVTDDATGDQLVKATTGPDGRVEGVARGPGIAVEVDPLVEPYVAVDASIALDQLDDQVTIEVGAALPTAVVSGVVDRADRPPIPGARVSFVSQVGDRLFTTATTTGEDGSYSAVVFQGDVTVAVDEPRVGKASVTTAVAADTTVDLVLTGPLLIDVAIDLQTRYAGDPAPTPVDLDPATGYHYYAFLRGPGRQSRVLDDVVTIPYHVGDAIRFCANGFEGGLPAGCADVAVDVATQTGTASLVLEQAGAITGALSWTATTFLQGQTYRAALRADVFRVDGASLTKISSVRPELVTTPDSGELQLAEFLAPLFEPGTFEIRFELHEYVTTPCQLVPGGDPLCGERWVRSEYARVRTTVPVDGIVDVGTLPFTVPGRRFTNAVGSSTTVTPGVVLPGGVASVRVAAVNGSPDDVTGATIEVDLPAGASVIPDSVTVDGQPSTSSVADNVLSVPVGDVPAGATAVVGASLAVAADIDADGLSIAGSISYGAVTEPLGSGAALVRRLSIDTFERTSQLDIPVWGRAAPGAAVEVTVDGVLAGNATATPGGFWSTRVELPEVPLPRTFALAARSTGPSGPVATPNRLVMFDEDQPVLQRVVFRQSGGRVVEFDPRQGLARFPYVWVPGQMMLVDLDFDQPAKVLPPVVWIGPHSTEAVFDPTSGLWRSALYVPAQDLGELRVSWEPVRAVPVLNPPTPQPLLTPAEVRSMLPPGLATFSDVTLVDPTPGAPVVSATFPDVSEAGETTELSVTTETIEYTPTDEDLELQAITGLPIWGLDITTAEQLDGSTELHVSFVVPQDALSDMEPVAYAPAPRQASGTVSLLWQLSWHLDKAWTAATATSDLSGAINAGEVPDKLAELLGKVESKCPAGPAADFLEMLQLLNVYYLGAAGLNAALMLLGVLLGPETLGLGTLAAWGLAELINTIVGDDLKLEIKELEASIELVCDPDEEQEEPDPDCAPEWALVPPSLGGPDCQPLADITVIVDPSGFVYEVLEEQRVEGVTATLETAASPTGPWTIWDAEWFLQQNPLFTDADGRYAWDVPEGWWRVRWEKDGYETQYSEPLEVFPPHFDVNADLRNLTPPTVASASATAGQSVIEVTFDQLMDVDFVTAETMEVVAPAGEDWTVSAVDEQTTGAGDPVATTFTVDLGRTLAEGEQLGVDIDLVVRSASGVLVEPSGTLDVTVHAAPPEPQTITFAPIGDVVYGVPPVAVSPTASSGLPVALTAAGPCSIQGGTSVAVNGVGTCSVTATQAGNSAWLAATPVVRAFDIAPRPLTVTAHSATSTVGDPKPSFGATALGLRAGDTIGSLGGLSCASAAPASGGVLTTAGTFAVTCSGLKAPNYTVSYVAGTHTVQAGPEPEPEPEPEPRPAASTVVPARLLETRVGEGLETIDGLFEGVGRVAAGGVIEVDVSGRGGVPDGVGAVMLNVTAIRPDATGYLTVYPCDEPRPLASNVNYSAGQVIPNAVLAKVAAVGTVCIFTWAATDLAVDVNGYIP